MSSKLMLGIETSCDETAAALVLNGREVIASVVSSQADLHERYGGVVPEIAGRAHIERFLPVVIETLEQAGLSFEMVRKDPSAHLEGIAVTVGPGLIGSLLIGIAGAKSLALAWGLPLIGVNHLEGHLYASFLETPTLLLPAVVLLVSGGHSLLVEMSAPGEYRVLSRTLDDAAGEAFDKVARYLDLGYPGGPAIERAAREGNAESIAFPRPMLNEGLDFSFSGLKTAVVQYVKANPRTKNEDIAASFQQAVVDVLVHKSIVAAEQIAARTICLAGGVAANTPLRAALSRATGERGLEAFLPSLAFCTDNAAMIAAAGHFRIEKDGPSSLAQGALPGLDFPTTS